MLAKAACFPLTPTLSPKKTVAVFVYLGRGEGDPRWLLWIAL